MSLIQLEPNNWENYYIYADMLFALLDVENAIKIQTKVIEFTANNANMLARRAVMKRTISDFNSALADCEEALKIAPKCHFAYYTRAVIRRNLKDYKGALEDSNKCIELDPNAKFEYYANRAVTYDILGDYENALKDYDKALDICPNFTGGYFMRAETNFKTGKLEVALQDYTQAIQLWPQFVDAYIRRAEVFLQQNYLEAAERDIKQAMTLPISAAATREKIENLQREAERMFAQSIVHNLDSLDTSTPKRVFDESKAEIVEEQDAFKKNKKSKASSTEPPYPTYTSIFEPIKPAGEVNDQNAGLRK